jgi:hypothetical protein
MDSATAPGRARLIVIEIEDANGALLREALELVGRRFGQEPAAPRASFQEVAAIEHQPELNGPEAGPVAAPANRGPGRPRKLQPRPGGRKLIRVTVDGHPGRVFSCDEAAAAIGCHSSAIRSALNVASANGKDCASVKGRIVRPAPEAGSGE